MMATVLLFPCAVPVPVLHHKFTGLPIAQFQTVSQKKMVVIPTKLETGPTDINQSMGIVLTVNCHLRC